jgi:hypothetical protein
MNAGGPRRMKRSLKASTTSVDVEPVFNQDHQRLFCKLINDIQPAKDAPVVGAILNKIIGPNVVWPLRPQAHAGPVGQPKPTLLWLFLWDLQPLPSPDSFYALMICVPSAAIQHACNHTIAVSPERFCQHDNILGQPFFIRQAMWHFALRRTMLAECAANPALRYAEDYRT